MNMESWLDCIFMPRRVSMLVRWSVRAANEKYVDVVESQDFYFSFHVGPDAPSSWF